MRKMKRIAFAAAAFVVLVLATPAVALPGPALPAPGALLPPFPHGRDGNNTAQDTVPPSLAVRSHRDGQTVSGTSITLSGTASDDSGTVSSVEVSLNGGDWLPAFGSSGWSLPLRLEEGKNSISVRALDPGGNVARLDLSIVSSTRPRDNSGVLLAVAVVAPIVAILALFALRRRPPAVEPSGPGTEGIEERLEREGRKPDAGDEGPKDSEEVTRPDERPSKKPPARRRP